MSEGVMVTDKMTDTSVGELIGLSYVQVNRIRNGTRWPSIQAMLRIEQVLGWDFQSQGDARRAGDYASKFEEAVARYASTRNTAVGPGDLAAPDPTATSRQRGT